MGARGGPGSMRVFFPVVVLSLLVACGSADEEPDPVPSDRAVDPTADPGSHPCQEDADCPSGLPHCGAADVCVACTTSDHCKAGQICYEGHCVLCEAGRKTCAGKTALLCDPFASEFEVVEVCAADGVCQGGKCFSCYPETKKCEGSVAYQCDGLGEAWAEIQDCASGGLQCYLGVCLNPCSNDFKANTNAGCGFFAVDLDNGVQTGGGQIWDAWNAQFAVIVSNASSEETATVTVTNPDGDATERKVGPRSLQVFELPAVWGQEGTRRSKSAFRIQSDRVISVYQFNPLSNAGDFSTDASVLLPAAGLGREYWVLSHAQIEEQFRGFFAIVGISEAPTKVTVTPTAPTLAGSDIPALLPGEEATLTILQGEVVNIESDAPGADLTGTKVLGDGPLQVMSGHEAAVTSDRCCADHLEQQLVPTSSWGTEYLMTRSVERWAEKDWYRILAHSAGTEVTVSPAVIEPSTFTLGAGQFVEIHTAEHFRVTATKSVLVGQYLASSFEILPGTPSGTGSCANDSECPPNFTCKGVACQPPPCGADGACPPGHLCTGTQCVPAGDPALILGVPRSQWRKSYVFLAPENYAQDYVNIVMQKGTTATLDGVTLPVGVLEDVGASDYHVYRAQISDGVHQVSASEPVSVIVYGYDKDVSYGYPGGLGLSPGE